jgi:hypothetical protein
MGLTELPKLRPLVSAWAAAGLLAASLGCADDGVHGGDDPRDEGKTQRTVGAAGAAGNGSRGGQGGAPGGDRGSGGSGGSGGSAVRDEASAGTGGGIGVGGSGGEYTGPPFADCFDGWQSPDALVVAVAWPDPDEHDAVRYTLSYGRSPEGDAQVLLERVDGRPIARLSDGPFSVETHVGAWVELRSMDGRTLYTRQVHELVPESVELVGPNGDLENQRGCPGVGIIVLDAFPNRAEAAYLVLFQQPVDGQGGGATTELVRFPLS